MENEIMNSSTCCSAGLHLLNHKCIVSKRCGCDSAYASQCAVCDSVLTLRRIYVPDQVFASNARSLDGSTNETGTSEPNAPGSANNRQSQSKCNSEVSVPIWGHVGKDLRPSLITEFGCTRHGAGLFGALYGEWHVCERGVFLLMGVLQCLMIFNVLSLSLFINYELYSNIIIHVCIQ
jgi:hypothetical protein